MLERVSAGDLAPVGGPTPPSPGRSRNMAAIRRRDTKPELALRRALHARGLRFRVDHRLDLPTGRVRPDIVFTRWRVVVFVDGCYWHACPDHGRRPSVNGDYWGPKLERTSARDAANTAALRVAGWLVVRVWEHEDAAAAARRVTDSLVARQRGRVLRTKHARTASHAAEITVASSP